MFASSKLLTIRNADDFISKFRPEMEDYVQAPVDSAALVLRCKSLPGNQKISKLIAKHGKVIPCEPPKGDKLPGWIVQRAAHHALQIKPDAARALADLIGGDLGRIDNELAKLALSATGPVGEAEVKNSVVFQRDQEMWHMTDELTAGKIEKAIERWRHLLQADSSTEFRAVTWLSLWLEKALKAHVLRQQKVSTPAIAKELRIWPASNVDALLRTADRLGTRGLQHALDLLADLDYRSKTGVADASDNVERFMLSLAKSH
jgi:DNA polymerase III delta subunit